MSRGRKALRWLPVVALSLIHFPAYFASARGGLDGSWIVGINWIRLSDLEFGTDLVFTYGPLGFLLFPLPIGTNLLVANLFRLGAHALFVWLLIALRGRVSTARLWAFGIAYTASVLLGLWYEYHLLVILGAAMLLANERATVGRFEPWVHATAAGAFAGVLLLIKLTLGIAVLIMGAGAVVAWLVQRRFPVRVVACFLAGFLATAGFLAGTDFSSPHAFLQWLMLSREIVGEHAVAMSLVGASEVLVLGVLSLAILIWIVGSNAARSLDFALVFLPIALLGYRHGFTRQDPHVLAFFPTTVAIAAFGILRARGLRETRVAAGGCITAVLLALPAGLYYNHDGLRAAPGFVFGIDGARSIAHLLAYSDERRELAIRSERALRSARLPQEFLDRLGADAATRESPDTGDGSVRSEANRRYPPPLPFESRTSTAAQRRSPLGVLPWDIASVATSGRPWWPLLTLQSHLTYTAELDRRTAAQIQSRGPENFVLQFAEIDDRHPLFTVPATVRELLECYEPDAVDLTTGWILLSRRAAPYELDAAIVAVTSARFGEWIDLPEAQPAFAGIQLRPNLLGQALRATFRVPAVWIDLESSTGAVSSWRLVPATAENGLFVGRSVRNAADLAAVLGTHSEIPPPPRTGRAANRRRSAVSGYAVKERTTTCPPWLSNGAGAGRSLRMQAGSLRATAKPIWNPEPRRA